MIVLFACITIVYEIIPPYFYKKYLGFDFDIKQTSSLIYYLAYTYVCLAIIPFLYAHFVLKENRDSLALRWPQFKLKAWLLILCSVPIFFACSAIMAKLPVFQYYYGFSHHVSLLKFITIQVTMLPLYYMAEEFFFRGFILYTLFKRIGWHAIWITEFLFVIAHVSKPGLEILFAIPVGVVLNLLTLWTRSIVPAIVYHTGIGILLNVFVLLN